jgi:hypothetical protein
MLLRILPADGHLVVVEPSSSRCKQLADLDTRAEIWTALPLPHRMHLSGERLKWYQSMFPEFAETEPDQFSEALPDDNLFLALERFEFEPGCILLEGPKQDGYLELLLLTSLVTKPVLLGLNGTDTLRHKQNVTLIKNDHRFTGNQIDETFWLGVFKP